MAVEVRIRKSYAMQCDGCGSYAREGASESEAHVNAINTGWGTNAVWNGLKHIAVRFCPPCHAMVTSMEEEANEQA